MTTLNSISGSAGSLGQFDPQALPVSAAQAIVLQWVTPLAQSERVPLRDALARVLARDVISPIDVPAHDNSAMDGYAFDGASLLAQAAPASATLTLNVAGKAFAGHPYTGAVAPGTCVRIMTGAPMPTGCDTVVPQERVEHSGGAEPAAVTFRADAVTPGANRRRKGEDLARGSAALRAGRVLRASDIGLMASLGIVDVAVKRRLRVAFFSTGDELRSPGEPLDAGCIYDSNRYTLGAMLQRLNAEPIDLGRVRDDPESLAATLKTAAESADVVLTSGGVSVGEADFTRTQLQALGDVSFWGLAMRPGRPLAFGRIWSGGRPGAGRAALLFGLPGNPVATMVAFYQIVRPALIAMSGATPQPMPLIPARCDTPIRKRPGRTEFQRGIAERDAQGQWRVAPTGSQSSGALSTMSEANCFIVLAHESADLDAGDTVDIMLFDGLV
ncbi:Molybdopterin molybdenumtransferase [Paraburkholderia caffeinitolerans]|uniref:Molybdopterin molybdenumtransferase n=1 Tax=Paraburkholderia caffeinitolerans TaxID=1723730 RepID=A0A6J5G9C1_9BURK|nr:MULTISPECIES: gephyrin-like molybdotransferase Glp [Paraburkholderia]CAB3794801.1 Molybdopterin molybdenumtransferase [Paraburkholderia caffeinitolerans]